MHNGVTVFLCSQYWICHSSSSINLEQTNLLFRPILNLQSRLNRKQFDTDFPSSATVRGPPLSPWQASVPWVQAHRRLGRELSLLSYIVNSRRGVGDSEEVAALCAGRAQDLGVEADDIVCIITECHMCFEDLITCTCTCT